MNDINDWKRYYGEERVKRAELEVATDELVEAAEMVLACIDQPRSRDNSEHAGLDASEALRKATTEVKEFNSATLQYVNGLAAGDLPMVGDLSMLVARLARKLLKATPADELPAQALDYLSRNELNGSQECERNIKHEATITQQTEQLSVSATAIEELSKAAVRQAEHIEEQRGTIKALNMALGGDDSTSTENLIDAHEVDYNEEGLISLSRKLIAENVRLGDTVESQKAAWTSDYEQLVEAEKLTKQQSERIKELEEILRGIPL